MPITTEEMQEIMDRLDERYMKKAECDKRVDETSKKLANDDKELAVIKYRLTINNWLSLTIVGGIIALLIKIFLGG